MPHLEGEPQNPRQSRAKSVHTVDWITLQKIRGEVCRRGHTGDDPMLSSEELAKCWLNVVEAEQTRHKCPPLSSRDKEFIEIRVSQSMREVDPQCSGLVDVDVWAHHMLLTRASPPAMRAMLQINRLLEVALHFCPGILVGLQHALEVELPAVSPDSIGEDGDGTTSGSTCLPFSEVMGIYGRKLWHLRPGAKDCPTKRRTDFSYRTPDEFVKNTAKAMDLDGSNKVTSADFLALCLGRREWQVTLHLYDLSKGLAQVLSPWLLKEQLEGVWHTGLVVFGKEYYFGGDIYYDTPAKTGFGTPRTAIHLGSTLRQKDELHAFIVDELKPIFSREAYDAARNNCNHFTDRVSMYLVGKHIPDEVLRQPELMMQSRLGRTLRPILTKVLGQYFEPKASAEEISFAGIGSMRSADKAARALQGAEAGKEDFWGSTVTL
mmetsp:Transcript_30342/g.97017  ORF Transcript_30342/g.97017 Transcript_30342/m.97017 type:complete len:434 (+) Transcript_30342:145-1446(+)